MANRFGGGKAVKGKHAAGAHAAGQAFANQGDGGDAQKGSAGKVALIVAGVIVGLVALVYLLGALAFSFVFMPGTTLDGADVSLKFASEVAADKASGVSAFQSQVVGDNFSLMVRGQDVDLAFDKDAYAGALIAQQHAFAWPLHIAEHHELQGSDGATFDSDKLTELLGSAIDEYNASATQPTNATIAFDDKTQQYVVVPEKVGTALDRDATIEAVGEGLRGLSRRIALDDTCLSQPTVTSDDASLATAAQNANRFMTADIPLTLNGQAAGEVTRAQISSWITLDENLNATLDDAKLGEWLKSEVAAKYDTRGAARAYTRPDGKAVTVDATGSNHWDDAYGWVTDEEALATALKQAVEAGSTSAIEIPTKSTAQAAPDAGLKDWGNRYIDIDLAEQHVRMYDDSGALVWESDCVTGDHAQGHDTPVGVYTLNGYRASGNVELRGTIDPATNEPEYISHVGYWMPFIGNSWALHDANWRSRFGGDIYQYAGSHGCVNLPADKAKELFGLCKVGDVVVVHN